MIKNIWRDCPFCGDLPDYKLIPAHEHGLHINGKPFMPPVPDRHIIECGCGCGLIDDTKEKLLERWNNRALEPNKELINMAVASKGDLIRIIKDLKQKLENLQKQAISSGFRIKDIHDDKNINAHSKLVCLLEVLPEDTLTSCLWSILTEWDNDMSELQKTREEAEKWKGQFHSMMANGKQQKKNNERLKERIVELEKSLECVKENLKHLDLDTRSDEPNYSIWSHRTYSLSMEIIDKTLAKKGGI